MPTTSTISQSQSQLRHRQSQIQSQTIHQPQPNDQQQQPQQQQQQQPNASDTIRSAAAGLSAHLFYQVTARLLSFVLKAVVVRALRPAQFAFVEIRVVLLVSLALLPAISGFRPVTLRQTSDTRASALLLFNVLFTLTLGLILGTLAIVFDPQNTLALLIVVISNFIRAFSEIPVIFVRRRARYTQASRARAISIVFSALAQTIAVSVVTKQHAAPASAMGHLAYVISLGLTMYFALGPQGIPRQTFSFNTMRQNLRKEDLVMASVATGEGVIKFLLENGEAIILDISTTASVKGAYKIAANLGSVFARFFSEALEEQAFNVFSRLSDSFRTSSTSPSTDNNNSNNINDNNNDIERRRRRADRMSVCFDTLTLGLKAAISISLVFALVGPRFAYALLRLLYGTVWADDTAAASILSAYFIYVVFMAGNGVSEAFVTASASTSELKSRTMFSTTLSVCYMVCLYQAARTFGAVGVIAVNCANMACRTVYSAWFFTHFTRIPISTLLQRALPHYGVVATLLIGRYLATLSEAHFLGTSGHRLPLQGQMDMLVRIASHAVSGVVALILFAGSIWTFERDFLRRIRSIRSHQD